MIYITDSFKPIILTVLFAIISIGYAIEPQPVYAAPDWEVTIQVEVQADDARNKLMIGADTTATDGYDSQWDAYALGSGNLDSYFIHPEWGIAHSDLDQDIRAHASGSTIEWPLLVNYTVPGATVMISWDLSNIPANYPLVLHNDTAGEQTDMRSTSSYSFTYSGITSLRVAVTESSSDSDGDGIPDGIDTCPLDQPVRILASPYPTLQDGYNAAFNNDTIMSHDEVLTGNFILDIDKTVTLKPGYDCSYTSDTGITTLQGNMTVDSTSGKLIIDGSGMLVID